MLLLGKLQNDTTLFQYEEKFFELTISKMQSQFVWTPKFGGSTIYGGALFWGGGTISGEF